MFPVLAFGVVMFLPLLSYAAYFMFLKGKKKEMTIQASQPESVVIEEEQ